VPFGTHPFLRGVSALHKEMDLSNFELYDPIGNIVKTGVVRH
jgi:hypothetical protein